jgi:4-aminobutyrate aminotransferase-like enzyme
VPPRKFLDRVQQVARDNGILIIVDEVQSGMVRTGKMFASEHFGVRPDMITIAKGIASGLPLGLCVAKDSVMKWVPGSPPAPLVEPQSHALPPWRPFACSRSGTWKMPVSKARVS